MEIFQHNWIGDLNKIIDQTKHRDNIYKFKNTYCSSCGAAFGPGNSGYSHCKDHEFIKSINTWDESED